MSEQTLCERCVALYGECKYQEIKDSGKYLSLWCCAGRSETFVLIYPIVKEIFQIMKDAGYLKWKGPDHIEEMISGNATNALLTYLEEHSGTVVHYHDEEKDEFMKIAQYFDPEWIFKKKIDWQQELPKYKKEPEEEAQ